MAEPKLPLDRFTVALNILLDYLKIPDEQNLPALWHNWANCKKRKEFNLLTDQL
jgi:hypothetical protein